LTPIKAGSREGEKTGEQPGSDHPARFDFGFS
jgi:hypothetical protein